MCTPPNAVNAYLNLAQSFIHQRICPTGFASLDLFFPSTHAHQVGMCNPCTCNGNVDPSLGPVCDTDTGSCLNCINNTTGPTCGECLNGFYGDPFNGGCRGKCRALLCASNLLFTMGNGRQELYHPHLFILSPLTPFLESSYVVPMCCSVSSVCLLRTCVSMVLLCWGTNVTVLYYATLQHVNVTAMAL